MSRRIVNPGADRAAQNQNTIKSLLKLEGNKMCADCKKNKRKLPPASSDNLLLRTDLLIPNRPFQDPRWASWNLGVFICIRCSGIHRGMGTHISRVKSVDLDTWTDEQLQSVLKWGNNRANKYWEAKLAPGHVPSESKMENFIRTKYESKRWVMEGPMPDPSTLDDEGDDDIPLNVVQEKQKLERSISTRASGAPQSPPQITRQTQDLDILGGEAPSKLPSLNQELAPKNQAPPPKQAKPAESLLGLDFFGTSNSSSFASTPEKPQTDSNQSRPDLKQSILSLYASNPRQQPQQSQNIYSSNYGVSQPGPPRQQQSSSFAGMDDAFGGLGLGANTAPQAQQQPIKPSPFENLSNFSAKRSTPAAPQLSPSTTISGAGFFNTIPKSPNNQSSQTQRSLDTPKSASGLAFNAGTTSANLASNKNFGDMFDFASNSPPPAVSQKPISPAIPPSDSPFNISKPLAPSQAKKTIHGFPLNGSPSLSSTDAWGSNNAWGSTQSSGGVNKPPSSTPSTTNAFGWGSGKTVAGISAGSGGISTFGAISSPPKVSSDEDFGGWSSASPIKSPTNNKPSGTGGLGGEDLFSNVWQ
ncbi:MAG: hypothetical protein M1829_006049 [Trizodia sp. TS-e1964]|nr:MAG: hypothetical protein M1829_006049 [Trizodia sp. TS-e1964]